MAFAVEEGRPRRLPRTQRLGQDHHHAHGARAAARRRRRGALGGPPGRSRGRGPASATCPRSGVSTAACRCSTRSSTSPRWPGLAPREADAAARRWLEALGLGDRLRRRRGQPLPRQPTAGPARRGPGPRPRAAGPRRAASPGSTPSPPTPCNDSSPTRPSRGRSVLFSSHQLDMVEELCRDVVIVDRGRVVAAGSVDRLRADEPVRTALRDLRRSPPPTLGVGRRILPDRPPLSPSHARPADLRGPGRPRPGRRPRPGLGRRGGRPASASSRPTSRSCSATPWPARPTPGCRRERDPVDRPGGPPRGPRAPPLPGLPHLLRRGDDRGRGPGGGTEVLQPDELEPRRGGGHRARRLRAHARLHRRTATQDAAAAHLTSYPDAAAGEQALRSGDHRRPLGPGRRPARVEESRTRRPSAPRCGRPPPGCSSTPTPPDLGLSTQQLQELLTPPHPRGPLVEPSGTDRHPYRAGPRRHHRPVRRDLDVRRVRPHRRRDREDQPHRRGPALPGRGGPPARRQGPRDRLARPRRARSPSAPRCWSPDRRRAPSRSRRSVSGAWPRPSGSSSSASPSTRPSTPRRGPW